MLRGQSVIVRAVREADLPELALLLSDVASLGDYLPTMMMSEVSLRQDFAQDGLLNDSVSRYVVTDLEGAIVGGVWWFKSVPYYDAVEVGYHIFSSEHRGRGYATEAARLLVDFIFQSQRVSRVELRVAVGHLASECIAGKLGFVAEGVNRCAAFSRGVLRDMRVFALLRREWELLNS